MYGTRSWYLLCYEMLEGPKQLVSFWFFFFFPGLNNNCDTGRKWGEKMPACVCASPGPCKAALHCPCCSWRQMPRPPRCWGWWGWSLWQAGAGGCPHPCAPSARGMSEPPRCIPWVLLPLLSWGGMCPTWEDFLGTVMCLASAVVPPELQGSWPFPRSPVYFA